MLESFRLLCDTATLRRSSRGSITGVIYVEIAGAAFPGVGWSDFPVVILGWWLSALRGLTKASSADLLFMDGPYRLRLISRDLSTYRLECLNRSNEPLVATGTDVDAFQFRSELRRAATDVSGACERQNWGSPDLTLLGSLAAQDEADRKLH